MEPQKTLNSQSNREKEKNLDFSLPDFKLQSYSNQNNMVLAFKKINVDQWNRKPRNKPLHIWSINLQQRGKEYTVGKREFLP